MSLALFSTHSFSALANSAPKSTACESFYASAQNRDAYIETYCELDADHVCSILAKELFRSEDSCKNGHTLVEEEFLVNVVQVGFVEHYEFAIEILGPSSKLIGSYRSGTEIIRGRIFYTLGYSTRTLALVALNDVRHNVYGFEKARDSENKNSLVISNDAAARSFQERVGSALIQGLLSRWRSANAG